MNIECSWEKVGHAILSKLKIDSGYGNGILALAFSTACQRSFRRNSRILGDILPPGAVWKGWNLVKCVKTPEDFWAYFSADVVENSCTKKTIP